MLHVDLQYGIYRLTYQQHTIFSYCVILRALQTPRHSILVKNEDERGNYQAYYSAYLKYAMGTLTGSDSLLITAIAGLCPFTNGAIVYQARGLNNAVWADQRVWDDDSLCGIWVNQQGKAAPATTPLGTIGKDQAYSLYPNPGDGDINLLQVMPDKRPVFAEVWDGAGRSIYKSQLAFADRKARLQLSHAKPGIYLLQLRDADGKYYTLKFTIQLQ